MIEKGYVDSQAANPCITKFCNVKGTDLLPLAFSPHDIFTFRSINQTPPRRAVLKKSNKALEENWKKDDSAQKLLKIWRAAC